MSASEYGFTRLRALPAERLTYVNNWISRGGEVMALTRHIHQEWKIWTDVNERTLFQQLNRYKKFMAEQAELELPEMRDKNGELVLKKFRTREIDVMEHLVSLVALQEKRIEMFVNQERKMGMPIAGVDRVMDSTRELLKDVQKVRFDLGLDEFKGVVQGAQLVRGASKTTTLPDGSSTTSSMYEALTLADQVLGRAMIPKNLRVEDGSDS